MVLEKLQLQKNNKIEIVNNECVLLDLVKEKDNAQIDYFNGTLTVKLGGVLWVKN